VSRLFGPARQNGIVVRDLDAALEYWTQTVGAGPFFRIDTIAHDYFFQREVELPAPAMSIALGNWGDLQIELIHPEDDSDATWHEFLRSRGGGMHHMSVWTSDFDAMIDTALARGMQYEARGQLTGGGRYAYFQSARPDEPLIEVADIGFEAQQLFDHIRDAAIDWDGSDPVRSLG